MATVKNKPIRSVAELAGNHFHIPSYQRGYRWTGAEVEDLLNDIKTFAKKSSSDAEAWYCLQPLVVRPRDDVSFEVIDGQQRLTTIWLISRYINEMWRGQKKDPTFDLEYESRRKTKGFLDDLRVDGQGSVAIDRTNIDFAHISQAYSTIVKWCGEQGDFNQDRFIGAFRHQVQFIWHEPSDSDGIRIFTRINKGKIPLTSGELIKALFLRSGNFADNGNGSTDRISLKQREIAGAWDGMEAALHDNGFWYFLCQDSQPPETRIDLIFRLLTDTTDEDDAYAVFRAYQRDFPDEPTEASIDRKWREVVECFQTLEAWFRNWELYHRIGYLISTGTRLSDLYWDSKKMRKSEFRRDIDRRISETLPKDLDGLRHIRSRVTNVLLLHNIATLLNSHDRHTRFPFDRYKQQKWDVEHIQSVGERMPESDKHQEEWLKDAVRFVEESDELKQEIRDFLESGNRDAESFRPIFQKVLDHFSESKKAEDIDDLSNLALLDSGTNRGYGNDVFPVKRAKIIERERTGTFVPVCTKNVFMKFYSREVKNFTFWSSHDQEAYFDDIHELLAPFLASDKKGGEE